jgi:cleavage and polyadenylation specificity factor subunit 4
MASKIGASVGGGNWKYAHGTAHYGRNFSVKWLKVFFFPLHLFCFSEFVSALNDKT